MLSGIHSIWQRLSEHTAACKVLELQGGIGGLLSRTSQFNLVQIELVYWFALIKEG